MADFCKQCAIAMLDEDTRDFAEFTTAAETAQGIYAQVLCEHCGVTYVDHEGTCVTDCSEHHANPATPPLA